MFKTHFFFHRTGLYPTFTSDNNPIYSLKIQFTQIFEKRLT